MSSGRYLCVTTCLISLIPHDMEKAEADLLDGLWIGEVVKDIPRQANLARVSRERPVMPGRLVLDDQLRQLAQCIEVLP